MEDKNKNLEKVLLSINNTISMLDNKATSILVALGIIFGLSTMMIEPLFRRTTLINCQVCSYVFGSIYLFSSIICMILLTTIIFPRRGNKKLIYNQYYIDIYNNKDNVEFLSNSPSNEQYLDQINNCSCIAHQKDILLRTAIIFLFVAIVSILITIVLMSFNISNPL